MQPEEASYPRHNWLPGAIPVDAHRFRVVDRKLAATLAAGGAELVETGAEVELGTGGTVRGDAPYVVVALDYIPREGGFRLLRASRRVTRSLEIRIRAERVRRNLRAQAYADRWVVPWEWEQALRLPWTGPSAKNLWSGGFPLGALVIGSRGGRRPTILDSALEQAGERIAASLDCGWPLATQGGLVAIAPEAVLRVAVGPARGHLSHQHDALTALEASSPPPQIARLVPDQLGDGSAGLGDWTLEQRLSGSPPPAQLPPELLDESIGFLVTLGGLGDNSTPTTSPSADAEAIARALGGDRAQALHRLGSQVEQRLADVPRIFAHGDFWSRNLLIDDGRLSGVVDWDHGGPGRLPFLDLLQLRLNMIRAGTHQFLGPALVEHLLPWARAGGDDHSRAYARQIGIEPTAQELETFVFAFWLDRIGHEVSSYADRVERPVWIEQNVDLVLQAIAAAGIFGAHPPRPRRSG